MSSHQNLSLVVERAIYPITKELLHKFFDPYGVEQLVVYPPIISEDGHPCVAADVRFRSERSAAQAYATWDGRCIYYRCCRLQMWIGLPEGLPAQSPTTATPATTAVLHEGGANLAAPTPSVVPDPTVDITGGVFTPVQASSDTAEPVLASAGLAQPSAPVPAIGEPPAVAVPVNSSPMVPATCSTECAAQVVTAATTTPTLLPWVSISSSSPGTSASTGMASAPCVAASVASSGTTEIFVASAGLAESRPPAPTTTTPLRVAAAVSIDTSAVTPEPCSVECVAQSVITSGGMVTVSSSLPSTAIVEELAMPTLFKHEQDTSFPISGVTTALHQDGVSQLAVEPVALHCSSSSHASSATSTTEKVIPTELAHNNDDGKHDASLIVAPVLNSVLSMPVLLSPSSTSEVGVIITAATVCISWELKLWLEPVPPRPPDQEGLSPGSWSGSRPEASITEWSAVHTVLLCNHAEDLPTYTLSDKVSQQDEVQQQPWPPPLPMYLYWENQLSCSWSLPVEDDLMLRKFVAHNSRTTVADCLTAPTILTPVAAMNQSSRLAIAPGTVDHEEQFIHLCASLNVLENILKKPCAEWQEVIWSGLISKDTCPLKIRCITLFRLLCLDMSSEEAFQWLSEGNHPTVQYFSDSVPRCVPEVSFALFQNEFAWQLEGSENYAADNLKNDGTKVLITWPLPNIYCCNTSALQSYNGTVGSELVRYYQVSKVPGVQLLRAFAFAVLSGLPLIRHPTVLVSPLLTSLRPA